MNEISKKKILIIGSSAKEHALVKKFAGYEEVGEIFVAPGNVAISDEQCKCVDIREENVKELLDFALENAIDLTIASSETAIKNNIASLFQNNGQLIFAPTAQSANISVSKSNGKKFLYKMHIPTPRFGAFDKSQLAIDYLNKSNMPVVIRADENLCSNDRTVCSTVLCGKNFIDDLYQRGETKVLIEDFAFGHEFCFYVVTDGYHSIPLTSVANYRFMSDGDGGILTSGMGSFAPDYKVSTLVEARLMKNVVTNVLSSLERRGTPYIGILGVDCVLTGEDKFMTLEFKTFLQDCDCEAVLNLIDENLLNLFTACANGSFADDYTQIKTSDNCSVSCVLHSIKSIGNLISGLNRLDDCDVSHYNTRKNSSLEYEAVGGKTLVITKTAKTLTRARDTLYEEIELISFTGKKFRKDICLGIK